MGPTAAATARPPSADGPRSRGAGDLPPAIRGPQPPPPHAPRRLVAPHRRGVGGTRLPAIRGPQPPPRHPCIGSGIIIFPRNINYFIPRVCLLPAILPVSYSPLGRKFEAITLGPCTPYLMFKVISSPGGHHEPGY